PILSAGMAEIRAAVKAAESVQALGRHTVLFIDEIHRFNKAQQDALLPHVESGLFVLVGATTENPSFSLNNALLSRTHVLVLSSLSEAELEQILQRAEALPEVGPLPLQPAARTALLQAAHGDGRSLLNLVELLLAVKPTAPLDVPSLQALLPKRVALYDRAGDWHYDLISALHKSVRGSDPDAALYYLARMLQGGEDGVYLARRLVRMAAEDVGLAEPNALPLAQAALQAYEKIGSPEADLMLAEVAVYLALAPKSNALYVAWKVAQQLAKATAELPPPPHIVNAPTKLMADLGHGAGYQYDHDAPAAFSGQNYWPEGVSRPSFYQPVERGFEREMAKRMAYFAKLRATR
ncbi:MAG: replication-associated recombination protein A, partial [Alphaproteobacteria bacterium]|nr:replication-associated recombination protein A [Alphaproteobacteria bacterium]